MLSVITMLLGKVTGSQIVTVLGLAVVAMAAGGIAFALVEHVAIWTGLYWSVETATTVGYGDVVPHNGPGRIVAVAVMVTAIPLLGATFALLAAAATATRLSKFVRVEHHLPAGRYVVLLGMHPTIKLVATELREAGLGVVVVADVERSALPSHVHHVPGQPTSEETVRATRPEDAQAVLLVSQDDGELLVTAVMLRHVAPRVPVVAVAQSSMVAAALADLGIERSISTEDLLGHTLAKSLETPHAADVLLALIDGEGYKLEELPVPEEHLGATLHAVRGSIEGLVLGVVHGGEIVLGIKENPVLVAGDRLVRVASEP